MSALELLDHNPTELARRRAIIHELERSGLFTDQPPNNVASMTSGEFELYERQFWPGNTRARAAAYARLLNDYYAAPPSLTATLRDRFIAAARFHRHQASIPSTPVDEHSMNASGTETANEPAVQAPSEDSQTTIHGTQADEGSLSEGDEEEGEEEDEEEDEEEEEEEDEEEEEEENEEEEEENDNDNDEEGIPPEIQTAIDLLQQYRNTQDERLLEAARDIMSR